MKIPCSVIRDLLPLYTEKMVEPETESLMKEHLDECEECRQKLSGMEAGTEAPVDTAEPLQALKKEIRKRRWYAAAIAALCVFVAVFTWSCHQDEWKPVPWEEGLAVVKGVEKRPYSELYPYAKPESQEEEEVLVIMMDDGWINGVRQSMYTEDDGTRTAVLEGWTSNESGNLTGEYSEMTFCPVPDRLFYSSGSQTKLLWGEPTNGGMEILPRLFLAYYVIASVVLAFVFGLIWFLFRSRSHSWIFRQLFFAPVSYIAGHLLIKGFSAISFFPEDDLLHIVLTTAAVYALLTLVWQVWLQRKKAL